MDKGFSEDELADIMNEIESLEKEFSGPEEKHQVLAELTEMTLKEATHENHGPVHENVHHIAGKQHPETHSSLSFKISGQMKLELGFDISDTKVNIHVNEKEGLVVELEGGAKFHIPLNSDSSYKKVS